jgi:hypothetical protein
MDYPIGHLALAPGGTGQVAGEAVHRAPTGQAAAELLQVPGTKAGAGGPVVGNQLVSDEAEHGTRLLQQEQG